MRVCLSWPAARSHNDRPWCAASRCSAAKAWWVTTIWQTIAAALDTFWTQPGKTTRVLSIARQVVTQRRPNSKVLPIPAQKTEALHCAADGNLRACASASCKARSQLCPTQVARNRLARLWAVPPRASRWWDFLKPGLELRAVFGTRAKHGLISNKCNKHKKYGVFL